MTRIHTNHRRAEKKSSARAAVRMLRKAGYTWANGAWQAPVITFAMSDGDIDELRRALVANKQTMQMLSYVERYERKEDETIKELKAKTACCMGVGSGDGNLFVYGTYESIKAAQALVFRAEANGGKLHQIAEPGQSTEGCKP